MSAELFANGLVVASHNAGKVSEISALLKPFGIRVLSAKSLGLPEPAETEDSFIGNARIKAHSAAIGSGLPALSDDSGLMVDALDGDPGVYTADWAETPNGRDFNMAMKSVWTKLEEINAAKPRLAQFCCTLCLALPTGEDAVFEGVVRGELTWPMRGNLGFGFDPMFIPKGASQTFGEMDPEQKHLISHRAKAFEKFMKAYFA